MRGQFIAQPEVPVSGAAITFHDLCVDLLLSGRPVRFRAPGASMHPTIRDGEVVTVAPVQARRIARGDVLLYLSDGGLTAHRVIRRLPGPEAAFRMRGDAPGSREERVAADNILGRVESVERDGRELQVGGFARGRVASLVRLSLKVRARVRRLLGMC